MAKQKTCSIGFDMDGAFLGKVVGDYYFYATPAQIIKEEEYFFQWLASYIKKSACDRVVIFLFSLRHNFTVDFASSVRNHTTSAVEVIKAFSEHLSKLIGCEITLKKMLISDIKDKRESGYHFDAISRLWQEYTKCSASHVHHSLRRINVKPEWKAKYEQIYNKPPEQSACQQDKTKLTMLYAYAHQLASDYSGNKHTCLLIDDAIGEVFYAMDESFGRPKKRGCGLWVQSVETDLLPRGFKVDRLYKDRNRGVFQKYGSPIIGTGEVDINYQETLRAIEFNSSCFAENVRCIRNMYPETTQLISGVRNTMGIQ